MQSKSIKKRKWKNNSKECWRQIKYRKKNE